MMWKETSHPSSRYNLSICLEELQKTTKQLSLHIECPGQYLTQVLSKYKSEALPLWLPTYLIIGSSKPLVFFTFDQIHMKNKALPNHLTFLDQAQNFKHINLRLRFFYQQMHLLLNI